MEANDFFAAIAIKEIINDQILRAMVTIALLPNLQNVDSKTLSDLIIESLTAAITPNPHFRSFNQIIEGWRNDQKDYGFVTTIPKWMQS